jgi:hypothetical protein
VLRRRVIFIWLREIFYAALAAPAPAPTLPYSKPTFENNQNV